MKKRTFCLMLLLALGVLAGCEKRGKVYPDAKIIRELPIMWDGAAIKPGAFVLVQSQQQLQELFSGEIPAALEGLTEDDFTECSLLIGYRIAIQEVAELQHSFVKLAGNHYVYTLSIFYYATLPVIGFAFGVVVGKLPADAHVELRVVDRL